MATALYCALTDVKNVLSTTGVTLRMDDTPPDSDDADILDAASREVDQYCLSAYSEENLAVSPWVKHKCKIIAAVMYCERRGNDVPGSLQRRYDAIIKRFEKVETGQVIIPDIPMRKTACPILSNVRVVQHPTPMTVVTTKRSTGEVQDYTQRKDDVDPLNWII